MEYSWRREHQEINAIRFSKKGRAKGGQLLGLKKDWCKEVNVTEWECGLLVKDESLKLNDKNINFVSIYNNVKMRNVQKSLETIMEEARRKDEYLLIIGDWNARIGGEQEMIWDDDQKIFFHEDVERVGSKPRKSEDVYSQ